MTSISGASQIKGVPITCQTPNDTNPFTCTSTYTVDALDDMSGTFSDFAVFTGSRVGGSFNIVSPTLAVPKSGGGPVSISVSSSPNPTQPGETVTVEAFISSMGCNAGLMPPGSLQVTIGSISQTLPLVAEFPYSTGDTVSFTTTALPAGSHALSASYVGGGGCAAGSATGTNHVVEPRPTATVTANAQSGSSQSFNISFSAPVSGLNASEITVVSTAGAVTRSLTGSGSSYVLTLTGMTQSGTISVTVPASVAQTPGGSQNLSSGSAVIANYIAPPIVSAVSPSSGTTLGGTTVTITGSALTGATAVTFGGQPATGITVNSATSITATTPATVPAGTPGAVSVLVTTPGGTNAANTLFTYRADQSISFTDPADIASFVLNQTVGLTATATSGLTVAFASTTPGVCSVSGSTATVLAAGTCTITANQAGNASYNPAPEVSQSFAISPANQSITFTDPADIASFVANQTVGLTATATSGLTVAFASTTPGICSVSGATATVLAAGTCTITANQAGNASYNPAPEVSQSFAISPANQSITFTSSVPSPAYVDGATYAVTAAGGPSTSPVVFSIAGGSGGVCTIAGNIVSFIGEGSCVVLANQAGDANYSAAPQVPQTVLVERQPQVITFTSTAPTNAVVGGQTYLVSANGGGSGNAVVFSIAGSASGICAIAGNTVSFIGAGTCVINANQAGNTTYLDAPEVQQSFAVAANTAPTADAGPDQTDVTPGATVTLDGTGSSDPDVGQTLGYAWLQTAGPTVTLSDATAAQPTFTAPLLNTGVNSETLAFQLTVTDGNGGSTSDTVSIIVVDNIAPTVGISGLPSAVTSGGSFTVTFTFSEPVTGFDATDIAVTNGTLSGFSGSGAIYTATITANGAGDVGLSIAAGAANDLAGNPSVASGAASVPLTATAETEELLADEALARNRALIASQPDLTRFLSGGRGGITVSSQGLGGLTFDIETNPDKSVWMALSGRWGSGDAALDRYVHGAFGAHLFRSKGLIFGAMLQADHGEHTDGLGRVESDGWLIGPYFVARFGDGDLRMSGSYLAGKTDIAVNPIGTYTDFVTSDRRLITFSLVDEIQMDQLLLRPRLDIAKVIEDRPGYTDGLGNPISAGKVAITEASAGVDFETPLAVAFGTARLSGGLSAIHSLEEVDGISDRSTRGRIDIGLLRDFGNGANLDFSASYDGIGSSEKGSVGLELQYSYKF